MDKRVITISSQTAAIKAQRLLESKRIRSRVVKLRPEQNERGCSHGVEVNESDLGAATVLLMENGIKYSGTARL